MASSAKGRLTAIGKQVAPAAVSDIPPITQVAPASTGPRAHGKIVIITGMPDRTLLMKNSSITSPDQGANSPIGIGRATAHQFAQNGAKAVYICDFDDKYLGHHEREINSLYPECDVHTRKFDAADEPAVKEVVGDALRRYGRLDVFFANAGITGFHALFTDVSQEDFMETLRVNTLGWVMALLILDAHGGPPRLQARLLKTLN